MSSKRRQRRTFSVQFKQDKVALLDSGKITVRELSRLYEVSDTAIYKWRKKYSSLASDECIVVEKISESKKNIELLAQIKLLEQSLGKKQLELDFYKEAISLLSEQAGEDVLKKLRPKL